MITGPSVEDLERQEAMLVFPRFSEDTAWEIGTALVAAARRVAALVVVDIRTPDRTLFPCGPARQRSGQRPLGSAQEQPHVAFASILVAGGPTTCGQRCERRLRFGSRPARLRRPWRELSHPGRERWRHRRDHRFGARIRGRPCHDRRRDRRASGPMIPLGHQNSPEPRNAIDQACGAHRGKSARFGTRSDAGAGAPRSAQAANAAPFELDGHRETTHQGTRPRTPPRLRPHASPHFSPGPS